MTKSTITTLLVVFICIFAIMMIIYSMVMERRKDSTSRDRKKYNGLINSWNHSEVIERLGSVVPMGNLEKIFNKAKNPWNMSIPTFQFIRFGGFIFFTILAFVTMIFAPWQVYVTSFMIAFLCWYYPMYYYKAIGHERETEWNKMYEFIWVIKHNIMLYDPAKAYMNVKIYIEQHAPHDLEIIQGFEDFYQYWADDGIDEYIERYYPFSVPREITQIIFNMSKTGEFPEQELNSLRKFIINTQDLAVEKTLSGVSSKATIFSLPFLMITVIISLMVPLLFQIVKMI